MKKFAKETMKSTPLRGEDKEGQYNQKRKPKKNGTTTLSKKKERIEGGVLNLGIKTVKEVDTGRRKRFRICNRTAWKEARDRNR